MREFDSVDVDINIRRKQTLEVIVIVIVIVMYLLTLHISILIRIESEERMIFLGGHPAKYWSPTSVCSVCVCVCVRACTALSGICYSGPSW